MDKSNHQNKAWLGIVLVVVGLAFLSDNLHFIPWHIPYYFFSWEMLLVVIGGAMLMTGRRAGFVFILIGAFFIIPDITGWSGMYIGNWWPIILIIVGISFIVRRGGFQRRSSADMKEGSDFDIVSILSGRNHVVDTEGFTGGKISAIFGGSEIDLTNAKLGSEPAVIDTFAMCGGTSMIVPEDWKVEVDITCILGGFSDSRRKATKEKVDPKKVLILKGFIMCGGGEIKSA